MLQRSPILRFALEVFEHALESSVSGRARDRKLAVLHHAQSIELAVKAALVEHNVSIYSRDAKTLSVHEALKQLAAQWAIPQLGMQARIELLIDERNALQHRYGDLDDVTLDYHTETTFRTLEDILSRDFDLSLSDWLRDNTPRELWSRVRFVQLPEERVPAPSEASLPDRSAALDLVDGFSRYESVVRELLRAAHQGIARVSTLDFAIKALAASQLPYSPLAKALPDVYRLRNRVVHGEGEATDEEVRLALELLDQVVEVLRQAPVDLVNRAIGTVRHGIRGARVLSAEELSVLDSLDAATAPPSSATVPPSLPVQAPVVPEMNA